MEGETKQSIEQVARRIAAQYENNDLLCGREGLTLPDRSVIIEMLKDLRKIMFPGYFGNIDLKAGLTEYFVGDSLIKLGDELIRQVRRALAYCKKDVSRAEEISREFIESLPGIQEYLLKDVQAGFDGDPAAKSKEGVIFSYPGLYAIFVYRIAHELYKRDVPFIPRIMTEYAHSRTGIDINSGAQIGEYFFIDHGTGVVIGETTVIGNHVKLYQGVTLGALSTRKGQKLRNVKRHPTIEDNVTIYANSTILGGETVIGHDSVISGNAFIVESVPAGTKVSVKTPELKMSAQKD
ncbi:MAG: serine acetyltransferase [Lachnospiraceae bacterium]|nr:serine acetyltransferase [Lachnospiraceae bacterium]